MRDLTDYETKVLDFIPKPPSWVTHKILVRLVYPILDLTKHAGRLTAVRAGCNRLYDRGLLAFDDSRIKTRVSRKYVE